MNITRILEKFGLVQRPIPQKVYDTGQIHRDTKLGGMIYDLVKTRLEIKTIVESGTWNGLGTTKCVLDGLRPDQKFWSVELYPEMYKMALENNKLYIGDPRVKFLLGSIVSYKDAFWFDHKSLFNNPSRHTKLWYKKDMKLLKSAKNIMSQLPENIDLLILDGGEYSTYPEWKKLKSHTRIVVLDDTAVLKCAKIEEELMNDKDYICLSRDPKERNGYAIYERVG